MRFAPAPVAIIIRCTSGTRETFFARGLYQDVGISRELAERLFVTDGTAPESAVLEGRNGRLLKVFDPHVAVDLFNGYSALILASPKKGRKKALKAVQAVTQNPEAAELLIRICLAVAEAKGKKGLIDQIEIVTLCTILGVEPKFAGLYTDGSSDALIRDA